MEHLKIMPNALGFILVGEGLISRGDLYLGLREHERTGEPLGKSLHQLGLLDEDSLTQALAIQAHCERLEGGLLPELLRQQPGQRPEAWVALEATLDALVIGEHEGVLYLAITDARAIHKLLEFDRLVELDFGVYVVSELDFKASRAILSGEPEPADTSNSLAESIPDAPVGAEDEDLGFGMCRIGYYEASEALFEAPDFGSLGAIAASALSHFFPHVASFGLSDSELTLFAKTSPGELHSKCLEAFVPAKEPFYGAPGEHPGGSALIEWVGFGVSPAILVVCWPFGDDFLVLLGAHEGADEVYGDLNDVTGLFQEVETALNVLNNPSTNG